MVLKVVLRALISSMQDLGDSAGAFANQDVELANVGAEVVKDNISMNVEMDASPNDQAQAAQEQRSDAEQEPFVDESALTQFDKDPEEPGKIEEEPLVLRDRRDFLKVSVEDLNADFQITFVEGGGAPMDEAVQQQNLVGLLQPYMGLWEAAQQPGPQAFLARQYMKAMAEKFNLPKDLHPDELDSKIAEEQESDQSGTDDTLAAAAQPNQQPAAPDLSDLAQLPPAEAIAALREIFANEPEMQQVLDQLEAAPPEKQAEMLAKLLSPGETGAPV